MKPALTPFVCALLVGAQSLSFAQTSENNDKLRDGLKRFPEADTNKDGAVSREEAKAYYASKEGPAR